MGGSHLGGFGGRGGFGDRPALVVVDLSLGFIDPESPLACDLEGPVENIARLLEAARASRIPVTSGFFGTPPGRPAHRRRRGHPRRNRRVPREAVGDRNPDAHEANLYDMDAKYGDVVGVEDALDYLEEVASARTR